MTLVIVPSVNCFQHSFFCVSDCIKGCSLRTWMHHAFNKRDSYAATQWQKSDTHATEIYIIYIYIILYRYRYIHAWSILDPHRSFPWESHALRITGLKASFSISFSKRDWQKLSQCLGKLHEVTLRPCMALLRFKRSIPVTSSHIQSQSPSWGLDSGSGQGAEHQFSTPPTAELQVATLP